MKKIVIIDTYPSNIKQQKILIDCIQKVKLLEYDIMLVSHYPIDVETQNLVNYYIYDYNNDFLPAKYTPHYYLNTPQFHLRIYQGGHTLPITRNIFTSF